MPLQVSVPRVRIGGPHGLGARALLQKRLGREFATKWTITRISSGDPIVG